MEKQTYNNHIRYYPLHHFIFYPVIMIATITCIIKACGDTVLSQIWWALAAVFIVIGWLSFMVRQHYALNNQNRIVRLEVRFRYFTLTGQRFELYEGRLSFGQIAALRFASDEELPALVQRALSESLTPKQIKQSIKAWKGDYMRV